MSFLISNRIAVGLLFWIRAIKRFAKFAAVDFCVFTDQLLDFRRIVEPALQVAGAELALGIFLVASALLWLASLQLRRRWLRLDGGRFKRGWRRCGGFVRQEVSPSARD